MNTLRIISDKSRYVVAALLVAFSVLVPALASAAQLTERSVELSSSTVNATANYTINFTTASAAGAVVVDFCGNSPLLGQVCNAPSGLSLLSATVGGGLTKDAASTSSKLVLTGSVAAGSVSIPVTGVTNPGGAGTIYARIITYSAASGATSYNSSSTGANNPGTHVDDGSVAIAITEGIAVSGDVLESLSFCVSGANPGANCSGTTAPTLKLGEDTGDGVTKALTSGAVSSGNIYTQITTNAVNGAVVRLKSSATNCGGLMRVGSTTCDIAPALQTDIANGQAKFGVKVGTAANASGAANPTGTVRIYPSSGYSTSAYALNFASGNASGVTSTYGDEFLDTNNAPVNNQNMPLTFGASINDNTPAGSYSTSLSLIATGKF